MNEKHYQRVLKHIKTWRPTRINPKFVTSNIMDITDIESIKNGTPNVGFMEAYQIHQRLQEENLIPKGLIIDELA